MTIEAIIAYLDGAAQTVEQLGIPQASAGAAMADGILKIIQSAMAAHKAITGQPLDLNNLKPIDPVK